MNKKIYPKGYPFWIKLKPFSNNKKQSTKSQNLPSNNIDCPGKFEISIANKIVNKQNSY